MARSPQKIQIASRSLLALDTNGDSQLSFIDELSPGRSDEGASQDQLVTQLMQLIATRMAC